MITSSVAVDFRQVGEAIVVTSSVAVDFRQVGRSSCGDL